MEENILICENCMEGIFTAIYVAYEKHYRPEKTMIQTSEEENLRLFAIYEVIESDAQKSEKVMRTLRKRFGEEGFLFFCHALASQDERKATVVYRTIAKGLRLAYPLGIMDRHADPDVSIVHKLRLNAWHEIHHLFGFLRFRELENHILFAEIKPKNDALPFLADHFADRFPNEHFLIYDEGRNYFAVHEAGRKWFLAESALFEKDSLTESREEQLYQELFRHFCHKIAIKERRNIELQKSMLPLRFRPFMTEFRKE